MSGQQHAPTALYPRERPGTHFTGGWVDPRVWTGGKARPHRDSIPDRPARSQSLYRLSYPLPTHTHTHIYIYIYLFIYTGLFKMIVGVLTTCHTQYT